VIERFYNNLVKLILTVLVIISPVTIFSGCSERIETPLINDDLTVQYPPKNGEGINTALTLCSKINKKYDKPVNVGTKFIIGEKEKIYAIVNLVNRENFLNRLLMFHLEWIGPGGMDIYRKRIDLDIGDSTSVLQSSISIPPDKRQPGNYSFKVYLFRELIAEKFFELIDSTGSAALPNYTGKFDKLDAEIILYNKLHKNNRTPLGHNDVFVIENKAKINALVNIKHRELLISTDLIFFTDWIDENDSSIFRKQIRISAYDSTSVIKSSISINKGERSPGNYKFRLYLFEKLLEEKNFKLKLSNGQRPEGESLIKKDDIISQIILCKNVSKKSGKPIGVDSIFTIKTNAKVTALVDLQIEETAKKGKLVFYVKWIGADNKSFHTKKISLSSIELPSSIKSSISILPSKREPGNYKFQLYYYDRLIGEKRFELISD
jgi:hypothetical protein